MAMSGMTRLTAVLLLATTADQFMLIALLWFVLEESGGSAAAAMVVLVHQVPAVVAGPLAGWLLDRFGAARSMLVDNFVRALCLSVVPLLQLAGRLDLTVVYFAVAAAGALSPFTYAGSRSLLPVLVQGRGLAGANSLLSVGDQLPYIFGPALGGILAASLGGAIAVMVPVALLLAAGLLAVGLPETGRPKTEEPYDASTWLGFRPLLTDPALRALLLLGIVYYVAYGPLEPALAAFARDRLHTGAAGFGTLWTAFGIGALAGLLLVRPLSRRGPGLMNALSVVAFGLVIAPLLLVDGLPAATAIMLLGGVAWGPYLALEASVIQRRVPARHLGGAFAARRSILLTVSPFGVGAGGALLTVLPPAAVIGLSSAACVLAGLGCLLIRDLREVRDPDATASDGSAATIQSDRC
jgi:hypothetical protein